MNLISKKLYTCLTLLGFITTFGQTPFKLHSDLNLTGSGIGLSNSKQHYGEACDSIGIFAIDSTTSYPIFCKKNNDDTKTWDYIKTGTTEAGAGGVMLQSKVLERNNYVRVNINQGYVPVDTISIKPISANSHIVIDASIHALIQGSNVDIIYGLFRYNDTEPLAEVNQYIHSQSTYFEPLNTLFAVDENVTLDGEEVKYVIKAKTLGDTANDDDLYYNHGGRTSFYKLTEISNDGTYFTQAGDTITSTSSVQGPISFQAIDNRPELSSTTTSETVVYGVTVYDNGDNFDGTYFTVPKAGPYEFCWTGLSHRDGRYYLTVNNKGIKTEDGSLSSADLSSSILSSGSEVPNYVHIATGDNQDANGYQASSECFIKNFSVGEKVGVYYHSPTPIKIHSDGYIRFSGHYLGVTKTVKNYEIKYNTAEAAQNLIINGAMRVAQRATTSTQATPGFAYFTVDRWRSGIADVSSTNYTMSQNTLTLSNDEEVFQQGFRNSFKMTNNAAAGFSQSDAVALISQRIEAQDMANSGWNYWDDQNKLTLSFWVKSSVASDKYKVAIRTHDGTQKTFVKSFEIPSSSVSNDEFTQIVITIPGHSDISMDDDNGVGLGVQIYLDNYNSGGAAQDDTWVSASVTAAIDFADGGTGWATTANATFELTGVQLEVGEQVSAFQRRTYAQELRLCQRYYEELKDATLTGFVNVNNISHILWTFLTPKRSFDYSLSYSSFGYHIPGVVTGNESHQLISPTIINTEQSTHSININFNPHSSISPSSVRFIEFFMRSIRVDNEL